MGVHKVLKDDYGFIHSVRVKLPNNTEVHISLQCRDNYKAQQKFDKNILKIMKLFVYSSSSNLREAASFPLHSFPEELVQ